MSDASFSDLHFLLDASGNLIVYQETDASWAGLLAFTSEERARTFQEQSGLEAAEIATIAADDRGALASLVGGVKKRAVRYLLVDLDYRTGECVRAELQGDGLGPATEHRFTPPRPTRH